ncbi:hypothetical protein [Corynebacterium auris]|uniref:hypothetical protein n=1 Tax=Corynebacterium auris TaxID=44750 RepID=UPI0025B30CA6|nr:hypothetical protein [Corynebacterium auris]
MALALCIYFLTTNERGAFIVCALIVAVLALFNVGARVDGDSLRVSVLGPPIKTVSAESVTGVKILQSAPTQEARTFGVHFLDGALPIHAGPANVLAHRGRKSRCALRWMTRLHAPARWSGTPSA